VTRLYGSGVSAGLERRRNIDRQPASRSLIGSPTEITFDYDQVDGSRVGWQGRSARTALDDRPGSVVRRADDPHSGRRAVEALLKVAAGSLSDAVEVLSRKVRPTFGHETTLQAGAVLSASY
jgi:hypothetical protein